MEAELADLTCAQLLGEKRRRMQKPRLLHRSPSAVGERQSRDDDELLGYTHAPSEAMNPCAGEAVDKETQDRITAAAHLREATRRRQDLYTNAQETQKRLSARLKAHVLGSARKDVDPMPLFAEIEKLIRQAEENLAR